MSWNAKKFWKQVRKYCCSRSRRFQTEVNWIHYQRTQLVLQLLRYKIFKPPVSFEKLPAHDQKCEVVSKLLQKKVYNLEDLNCPRISEILPEDTVASCSLHSNIFIADCQRFNHCAELKPEFFQSAQKVMHREETATVTTYLSDILKINTCLTPLDNQPIVILNRIQDPSPPVQNNFSSDQQNRVKYLNNKPHRAQPRYNSLYSAAAKRYFATITLSPE